MASSQDDQHGDLTPETVQGFKVGEKKTIDEYKNLDTSMSTDNSSGVFRKGPPRTFLRQGSLQAIQGPAPRRRSRLPKHVSRTVDTEELFRSRKSGDMGTAKPTFSSYRAADRDANDESLRKWKESLGIGTGSDLLDESDPRTVIMLSLGLEVEGRDDIIIDLKEKGAIEKLQSKPFTIKEGAVFRMKATFRVQRQILSGMKYVQRVSKMGLSSKTQEMIGSFPPNKEDKPQYEKKFEAETAPSGMLGRGHYKAVSKFIDDDNVTHLEFNWSFDIKKDW